MMYKVRGFSIKMCSISSCVCVSIVVRLSLGGFSVIFRGVRLRIVPSIIGSRVYGSVFSFTFHTQ